MNTGIELRHLRYFVCLADELHFGRAAERLGITQAQLSQQTKLLEERLGVTLFHRTTRRTVLTTAGATLLRHAVEVLDGADRAVAHTRAMASETTGRLVVAGVQVALSLYLPPILAAFRKVWPAIIVDVRPLGTGDQIRTLETGEINIAFLRPTHETGFMQMETVAREGFIAALPKGHALAAKPALELTDFAGEGMVGYGPILGASYANLVMKALMRAGVTPRIVQECTHTTVIASQVSSGLGVAILPSWITTLYSPYIEFRPVPELPTAIELAVAWPTGETSAPVLDFVDCARRIAPTVVREAV